MIKLTDILKEVVGVPVGIENSARKIYNNLLQAATQRKFTKIDKDTYATILNGNYTFSNLKLMQVTFTVFFKKVSFKDVNINKSTMANMNIGHKFRIKNLKLNFSPDMEANMSMTIATNSSSTPQDIIDFLKQDKTDIVSSIAHELKHFFDKRQNPEQDIHSYSKYDTYSILGTTGIKPIDMFFHYLYYMDKQENLVRPSEIKTQMDDLGITKDTFYDFLTKNDTYKKLKDIQSWDYNEFKKSLYNYIPEMESMLKAGNIPYNPTDKDIVDSMLTAIYATLVNISQQKTQALIGNSSSPNNEKKQKIDQYIKKDRKYVNNTDKFFLDKQEIFHNEASKMIKKLSKLVSLVNEQSIHNWELWAKINPNKIKFTDKIKNYN